MSAKHTPGPWVAELGSEGSFSIEADRAGIAGGLLVLASRNHHPLLADQMHANARLIAAAPDMLDALKRINDWCRFATEEDINARLMALQQIGVAARAAIAKAEAA